MKIDLTTKQVVQLSSFKDRVQTAAACGAPGMLVAQIFWDEDEDCYWMTPGFLDHEHAKLITEKGQRV